MATGGATGCDGGTSAPFSDTLDLPAGASQTYTVVAQVRSDATGQVTNTVRIDPAAGIDELDNNNNQDDDTDDPTPQVDLTAVKDDGLLEYVPGLTLTYTITVSNLGPSDAPGSVVTDALPAQFSSWTWTCGAATGGATGCDGGTSAPFSDTLDLPAGASQTYTVVAQVRSDATGQVTNTVRIDPAAGIDELDNNNNQDDDTDDPTPQVDLTAVKDDGLLEYVPGLTLTYTITVSNLGPSDAPGSVVTDALPAQFSSWTWTCGAATGGATGCDGGTSAPFSDTLDLPAGASQTYTVVAVVRSDATGQVTNTVRIDPAAGTTETNPGNNQDDDTDDPNPQSDLWLDKDDGQTEYVPGSPLVYTIVVHNDGPSDAPGSVVTDNIPAATLVSSWQWVCSGATGGATGCNGTSGFVSTNFSDVVNLPAGSSITYTVTANTLSSATADLLNIARVDPDPASIIEDPTPGNNQDDDTDTANPQVDLGVTKNDFTVPYVPGSFTTYTIIITNYGPSDAPGSTVFDAIPAQISDWAWTCAGTTGGAAGCTPYTGSGDFTDTVDLPASSSLTYSVLAHIYPDASSDLVNSVTVTPPGGIDELNPANNTATDTDTINPLADLSVIKDDGLDEYVPGTSITYVVTVSNLGPSTANNSLVSDAIPAQLSSWTWVCYASSGGATGCDGTPGAVTGNFSDTVNLPIGASITYHVTAVIRPDATGDLYNMARIDADSGISDPEPANNQDDDTDTSNPQADLSAVKDDGLLEYVAGTSLTYTIVITNSGPSDAPGSTISDAIPAQFSSWSWTCVEGNGATGCTPYTGSAGFSDVVDLPLNGVVTYTVTAQVASSATGALTNQVTVTPPSGSEDPTPGNNTGSDTDQPNPQMNLSITKTDGLADYTPGHPQVYTITVTNSGPSDAYNAVVSDAIPSAFSLWRWDCTAQTGGANGCTPTADTALDFSDTVNIPAGGSITYTVTAQVRLSAVGPLTNTAVITPGPGQDETDPADNSASDIDDVLQPDLTLTKSDGGAVALPGGTVAYTLVVTNVGGYPAYGVTLTERVPTYTTFNSAASSAGWTCAPDNNAGSLCGLDIGTMPGGNSLSFTFAVNVTNPLPSGVEEIFNSAVVVDDGTSGPDPTPGDNQDDEITPVNAAPDLRITKSDGVDVVGPGTRLTYTLVVANVGNQDAVNVLVQDTLPVGLDFVSATASGVYTDAVRTITWQLFDLGAGESVTFQVVVDVQNPIPEGLTAFLNSAAATDDGSNGSDPNPADNSASDLDQPGAVSKTILGTNQEVTDLLDVAIGEMVQYQVTLDVPTGTINNLTLTDQLNRGLVFVDCEVVATTSLTSSPISLDNICSQARVVSPIPVTSTNPADAGRSMTLSFGAVTNSGTETVPLTVRYWVVVLDNAENLDGLSLANQAQWTWDGGSLASVAPAVRILEPKLTLTKEANVKEVLPGSEVTYTLTIAHTADSHSDAFNVELSDVVPPALDYVPGSLVWVSGVVPTALDESNPLNLRVSYDVFTNSAVTSVLEFHAIVKSSAGPGTVINNTAVLAWTSLPGDLSAAQSPFNDLSTERGYQPGSSVDIYGVSAFVVIGVPEEVILPETGFAPGRVTALPLQPVSISYAETAVRLQIPQLGVNIPVVGVPLAQDGWDVTWLNQQAGWLDGTAFPTWNGNSVLTAHVYDANGLPGPFVNLSTLKYGDKIYIVTGGLRYRFEVRQTYFASPENLAPMRHEDLPWLTLITCRGYNAASDSYAQRMVVRAVLVSVEP